MTAIVKTKDIRQAFLAYFKHHAHTILPSSSLIPKDDPSLFFTNAGMVQFKKIFSGQESAKYSRVTTSQRCLRASGKHNDLEIVGYTNRHHTFFEMLGNFSFGDYGKREEIHYAWDFLTQELKVNPQKLWITVHAKDQESEKLWQDEFKKKGVLPQGLSHCGDKDNFWAMGETGPCGYCSEIYYDHGPRHAGDPPGGQNEGERYVEIWNLVFMQFMRDASGKLHPLAKLSIDAGMGLERMAAVMQGVHNNYATDVFIAMKEHFINILISKYHVTREQLKSKESHIALRVITDHIRAVVFLMADGVLPSNEKSGYVLRSIIRRAIYYLYRLGLREPCFFQLVSPVVSLLSDAYPDVPLVKLQDRIATLLIQEEQKFLDTLERGLKIFNQEVGQLSSNTIPGDVAFNLHDTYGLPIVLTTELARERNLSVDQEQFAQAMEKQRATSRAAINVSNASSVSLQLPVETPTTFIGYVEKECVTNVCAIYSQDGAPLSTIGGNEAGIVVLITTPFYAEAGGQIGDSGKIYAQGGTFIVDDTRKHSSHYLHYGHIQEGVLTKGSEVTAQIDGQKRQKITLNHSATHLLHSSLQAILGIHAVQRGSYVDAKKLRFDFTHNAALTAKQLLAIEQLVNKAIRANYAVTTAIKSLADAQQEGTQALFGEKYGEQVRIITMGEFSKELCGGTHVKRTGEVGVCKIIYDTSIASGVRRIEAVTGENALFEINQIGSELKEISRLVDSNPGQLCTAIEQLIKKQHVQEKELLYLQQEMIAAQSKKLEEKVIYVDGIAILTNKLLGIDIYKLRSTMDRLKEQLGTAIIVLATVVDTKVHVVVGVTKNLLDRFCADDLLRHILIQIDGKGGGRSDMAQGGGVKVEALQSALTSVVRWVRNKLQKKTMI